MKSTRVNNAIDVCLDIFSLSEVYNYESLQLKNAKFLTVLMLSTPVKGKKLAELHYR
ncbi:MAG: hypothetical protein ACI9LX_001195 [Paraglaciecola sp.]|jgi:hypothetical protein